MKESEILFISSNPDYLNLNINDRSVSGVGSQLDGSTKNIRDNLYLFLKKYNIKSIFDAPCGDFWWMKTINLFDIKYIGGDIIQNRMILLNSQYPDKHFFYFNVIENDGFPFVDLWFCRDLLFHLSNKDKKQALLNFTNSNIKYVLMSNHVNSNDNKDILTGTFGHINWQLEPWNFDLPIDILYDSNSGYDTKELQLYSREQIFNFLNKKSLI